MHFWLAVAKTLVQSGKSIHVYEGTLLTFTISTVNHSLGRAQHIGNSWVSTVLS